MIKAIRYEDIIKNLRKILSKQAEIDIDRILNAFSIRGPELTKILNGEEEMSYDATDCFIIFELNEDVNESNVAIVNNDNTIDYNANYTFLMKIYGNSSYYISQKICTRFKTEQVVNELHDLGIYLKGISNPSSVNEFINDTMWLRKDITFNLQVRHNIINLNDDKENFNTNCGESGLKTNLIVKSF